MTRLTKLQVMALRILAIDQWISPYMHKTLRKKGLVYSYRELTKKGRKALSDYRGVDTYGI
jgi:hypothetical protein